MSGLFGAPPSSNPFYADLQKPNKRSHRYDEEEDDEEDNEDKEDYTPKSIKTEHSQQIGDYIIIGETPLSEKKNFGINTHYSNVGSIPLKIFEINGLMFNLNHTTTEKHFFIRMQNGKYYAVKFRYDFRSRIVSYKMDQEDNPSKATAYELLDTISNGAFTKSAVQYKMDKQAQRKYLIVTVYRINQFGQVESHYNYKELELQSGVIEDARKKLGKPPGVDVYISARFIATLLHKEPNVPATPPVPSLLEDELDANIEYARNARQIYSYATRDALDLQAKFNAYRDFYFALFITTKPNPAKDKRKFESMSDIELKNYIKKLHHIVVNSELEDQIKHDIKEYLTSLYKSPDITKILELKSELTGLLGDAELIDLMGINNEVPIIDEDYFNDKKWMRHYHAGMAATSLMNKARLGSRFTKLIEPEMQNIKNIIDDPTVVSREKLRSINESLQKIKGIFLPKLMDFLKEIQSLAEYHPLLAEYVIINLDDLTKLQQLLDRLTQLFASSKLSKTEELFELTNSEELDGGSRVKNKKKTRKRTKKRNKKRNKSKRHKGYSRR
jgi:hypothetical protein